MAIYLLRQATKFIPNGMPFDLQLISLMKNGSDDGIYRVL